MPEPRDRSGFATGHDDGLDALARLDPESVASVDALVRAMGRTAFGGRSVGAAADVLEAMVRDRDCFRVVTVSGAMTVAKQGGVLVAMIERGWVQALVTTGAVIAHGLVEDLGGEHFRRPPGVPDEELYRRGYDRIYDTLELERNLDAVEQLLEVRLAELADGSALSSASLFALLGRQLEKSGRPRALLAAAARRGVPVYVPALSDSEIGLDLALHNARRLRNRRKALRLDPLLDLDDFASRVRSAARLGIFTVGGGVPRNWAQQVGPYLELRAQRLGERGPIARYRYGVRLCPEPEHWGGLSGCGYGEGVSWGKFVPESEGGRYAEVRADATIVWPLIVRAVMERLDADP